MEGMLERLNFVLLANILLTQQFVNCGIAVQFKIKWVLMHWTSLYESLIYTGQFSKFFVGRTKANVTGCLRQCSKIFHYIALGT